MKVRQFRDELATPRSLAGQPLDYRPAMKAHGVNLTSIVIGALCAGTSIVSLITSGFMLLRTIEYGPRSPLAAILTTAAVTFGLVFAYVGIRLINHGLRGK